MNRRTIGIPALALVWLVALSATVAVAAPETPPGGSSHRGVALARLGLSLRDDASLAELEPDSFERAPIGVGSPGAKNPLVAVLMSAVLPGWGELYTGHTARAKGFMAAEAAIWLGYAGFTIQGNLREDDYKDYARAFAGVSADAGADYWDDVSDFTRSEGFASYNESIRREARSLFPDDPEAQEAYFRANGYFGSLTWEWESEERFREFRRIKHDASVSFRSAFFMSGLAVLNRAVSAIDSAWMVRRYNRGIAGEPTARLSVTPDMSDGTLGGRAAIEITF
jgi:hypothetical protein